jgi:uncharacterized protein YbaP (TraB family)
MHRLTDIAEERALPLLNLMAALRLLLLAAFLLTLGFTAGQARAEGATCGGLDLLADLKQRDPTGYARLKAEADATENGNGLLWKVEKSGVEPSYLFGTMHVTDPRVTTLPPAAQAAFDNAGTVVLETTDLLDEAKMSAAIFQKPELMMFTDGTTLMSLLPPGEIDGFNKALEARGIPPFSVAKMKPWIISTVVALPACELARKAGGAPVLDEKLGLDARAHRKTLDGLETAVGQIEAMASLPMKFHVQGLIDTLKLNDQIEDVNETTILIYARGETGMFWPLFRSLSPSTASSEGYAEFEKTMVTARNKTMASNAAPIIDRGNAFVAVGALHLPGKEGLVSLLRQAGYTVTRAD